MAKVIEVSTDETLRLIAFHLESAKALANKGDLDGAKICIKAAEKWMDTISSRQLPLTPAAKQPDNDQNPPPTPPTATLDLPERHAAVTKTELPSCCGSFFESERGPCVKCKRHDDCIVLTRRFEADGPHGLLHQNWERADHKDRQIILGRSDPKKRTPAKQGNELRHCVGRYLPASPDQISVCSDCAIAKRCKRITADIAVDSDFATWWREATVPERIERFRKDE